MKKTSFQSFIKFLLGFLYSDIRNIIIASNDYSFKLSATAVELNLIRGYSIIIKDINRSPDHTFDKNFFRIYNNDKIPLFFILILSCFCKINFFLSHQKLGKILGMIKFAPRHTINYIDDGIETYRENLKNASDFFQERVKSCIVYDYGIPLSNKFSNKEIIKIRANSIFKHADDYNFISTIDSIYIASSYLEFDQNLVKDPVYFLNHTNPKKIININNDKIVNINKFNCPEATLLRFRGAIHLGVTSLILFLISNIKTRDYNCVVYLGAEFDNFNSIKNYVKVNKLNVIFK